MIIHTALLCFLLSFIEASEQPYKFWTPHKVTNHYYNTYQEIQDRKLDSGNRYNHVDNYYGNSYNGNGYGENSEYYTKYYSPYENQYNRNAYDSNGHGYDSNTYSGHYGYSNYDYVDYPVQQYSSNPVIRVLQQIIRMAKNGVNKIKSRFFTAIDRQFGPGGIPPALIAVAGTTAVATGGVLVTTGIADDIINAITDFIDPTTTTTAAPTTQRTTTTTQSSLVTGTSTTGASAGARYWF